MKLLDYVLMTLILKEIFLLLVSTVTTVILQHT